jgi:signal transduction histidine kinase/HAMP domain-containing protein
MRFMRAPREPERFIEGTITDRSRGLVGDSARSGASPVQASRMAQRPGIRFQLSIVLLLSALNSIVVVAFVIVLLSNQPQSAVETVEASEVAGRLSPTHLLGGLMGWVVLIGGLTVGFSFRLRSLLTDPLDALGAAARRVAQGHLDDPIPQGASALEVAELEASIEGMRGNLVRSIDELDTQNQLVTTMLDALRDGVVLVDAAQRVESWNPACAVLQRRLGLPQPRRGQHLSELIPPVIVRDDLRDEPTTRSLELVSGGVTTWIEIGIQPLARGHVLLQRDVTRLVEADNLKQEFLSVVTHELKTPLTAIQGYIRLLLMGKGGDLSAKQADLLQRSRKQADVLNIMVQDLLDATRLEGGNLQLDLQALDANQAAEDVVSAFSGEALSRRIKLRAELLDQPVLILVDSMRLQQILGNLVKNALKFTDGAGEVVVRARTQGTTLILEVEDDGRGIPPAALARLFEKFYQVDRGDTRKSGGAGLGLYICEQLARAMDGSLTVRSEVGRGSTFELRLPVHHDGATA